MPVVKDYFGRIQTVQTMDELKDVYGHFLLHYGRDIPKMQVSFSKFRAASRKLILSRRTLYESSACERSRKTSRARKDPHRLQI